MKSMQSAPELSKEKKAQRALHLGHIGGRVGVCIILAVSLSLLFEQVLIASRNYTDFCQDYYAAQRLLQGMPVYLPMHCSAGTTVDASPPLAFDAHPPPTLLVIWPLGLFSLISAATLWGILSLASYLASGFLLLRELGWRSLGSLALFMLGSVFWAPFTSAEALQNWGQLTLLLLVVAWLLERRGHFRWAGIMIGLAGLVKIWPAVFLVVAFFRRQWHLAWSAAFTLATGIALSAGMLGFQAYASYLGPVQASEVIWLPDWGNVSLPGVVVRFLVGYHDVWVTLLPLVQDVSLKQAAIIGEIGGVLLLAATLIFLWRCWRRRQSETVASLSTGVLTTMLLLTFPLTWSWGIITLLLPVTIMLLALRQLPSPPRWWFGICILSLLPALFQGMVFDASGWLNEQAGWHQELGTILFGLPTYGLLLFAFTQMWLLRNAVNASMPVETR